MGEKSQMRDVEESREDARVISDGRGSEEARHGDIWLAGAGDPRGGCNGWLRPG